MALPPTYILDQIRGLRGKPRITFPGNDTAKPKVERVLTLRKDAWEIPFLTPDVEIPSALLVDQQKVSEDAHNVDVYRAYQTLPGVSLTAISTDPETNEQISTTRQLVVSSTAVPANAGGIVYELEPIDANVSILVSRNVSNLIGKTWVDYPEIAYTFPGLLIVRGRSLSENTQPASYRSAFSRTIRARRELFFTTEPQEYQTFDPQMVTVRSDAGVFSDVLHNLSSAIIGGRRQKVEASEPSATDYPIGEEVLIRAPCTRAANGTYRNEHLYITAL